MAAMWRTAEGLVGASVHLSHQASDGVCNPGSAIAPDSALSRQGWRTWIPSLERTPPLVQFIARAALWLKAKFRSGEYQIPRLRLVGQLALGAKRHLSLVEVGGVQFLVGGGVEHVTVIVAVPPAGQSSTGKLQDAERPDPI